MAEINLFKKMRSNAGDKENFNADMFASDLLGASTSILSGLSSIAQNTSNLAEGANTSKYDYRLGEMDAAARREGYFNYDTLLNDRLNGPKTMSINDSDFQKSDSEIAAGIGGSTLSGAMAGLEVGGIWGAVAGGALGLLSSTGGLVHGNALRRNQKMNIENSMKLSSMDMYKQMEFNTDSVSEYMNRQQKANSLAEGGNLNNGSMSIYDTHGAYFSPGLVRIDAGGTHENNPYGGVMIGVDANGTPNLVEEGETVYGDFVFSDRLKPSKKILTDNNLPEKYFGKTYSEIAKILSEESDTRPNDTVSKNGLNAMLGRLSDAQEIHKEATKERQLKRQLDSMSPEELLAMGNQIGMMNQMAAQQQAQQQMAQQQGQMPEYQQQMEPQQQMNPMLGGAQYALGGNIYNKGSKNKNGQVYYDPKELMSNEWLSSVPGLNPAVVTAAGPNSLPYIPDGTMYTPEYLSMVPGLKSPVVTGRYPDNTGKVMLDPKGLLYNEELLSRDPNLRAPIVTAEASKTDSIFDSYSGKGYLSDPKGFDLFSYSPSPSPSPSQVQPQLNTKGPVIVEGDEVLGPPVPKSVFENRPDSVGPRRPMTVVNNPAPGTRRPIMPTVPLSLSDADLDNIINTTDDDFIDSLAYRGIAAGPIDAPSSGLAGNHQYTRNISDKALSRLRKKIERQEKKGKNNDSLPTAMRYAGPAMSAISALTNALTSPDRTIEDSYRSAMRFNSPVVDYRSALIDPRYDPLAVNMAQDAIVADAASNRRAIMNSGIGPAIMPTVAAMNYQAGQNIGNAHMQNRLGNTGMYNQAVQAHNQNEAMRTQGRMQAMYHNAMMRNQNDARNLQLLAYANQAHDAEDTARASAISQALSMASQGLSGIGRENMAFNMANSNPANMGYGIMSDGSITYNPVIRSCGGKIKKRK